VFQNPSWRHHYIPEFYLKQWAGKDGRLVEYSKPWADTVKPKRVYPRQTGFEDRLNELAGVPEPARQHLETHFYAPVDSAAASVLNALKTGRRASNARERLAWARFMTSLMVRNPENIRAAITRLNESIDRFDRATELRYQAARGPEDPETYSDFIQQTDLRDELSRAAKEAVALVVNDGLVVNHLVKMQWGALTLPFDGPPLLTSDRPQTVIKGLPDPECQVLLPLGLKMVFYAVNNIELAHSFAALWPAEIAESMNDLVVRRAQKYVYAMSDRHLDYVQANMGAVRKIPISAVRHPRAERRRRARQFGK
jgi:Protein of unknown function (DUF4238)